MKWCKNGVVGDKNRKKGREKPINTEVLEDMEAYKQEFIEFMVESDVLKFGDFTLKSGRKSPFFMNAGAYVTGSQLKRLGEYYAKAIHDTYGDDFDVLFGPAYKGIPLGVVTAIAYSELYGKEIRYCSDRKEEKDHGADKGSFLGRFGGGPKRAADSLLRHNLISVIASDAHSPLQRTPYMMDVYEELSREYSENHLDVLFQYNPARICDNREILRLEPVPYSGRQQLY